MQRDGHFNLLSLNQSRKIRMNQATAHRIDLTIVKHHFARADAFDVDREDGVSSGFGSQDRGQLTQGRDGRDGFTAAAINGDWNQSLATRAPRVILAATLAQLCLDRYILFSPP